MGAKLVQAFVVLLVGAFLGWQAGDVARSRGDERQVPDTGGREQCAEVAREIAALAETCRAMQTRLEDIASRQMAPTDSREPIGTPSSDWGEQCIAALDALELQVAAMADRMTSLRDERSPAQEPLPIRPDDDEARDAVKRRYWLWTYQEVLEAFGRPDYVGLEKLEGSEVLVWKFRRGEEDDSVVFWFRDGIVVNVEL